MVAPMLKRGLLVVVALLAIACIAAMVLLVPAHLDIRRARPPLPPIETVRTAVSAVADPPVRLTWINTSSQAMPRSSVLGSGDPHPQRPYRLSHSAFAVEWSDGRILLIDSGMTRPQAIAFGAMATWIGAEPLVVYTTVAEALGERAADVAGITFTHLHVDHVDGAGELCTPGEPGRIAAFLNDAQLHQTNHTTGAALDSVRRLECLRLVETGAAGLLPLEGFSGVFVIPAAGHTPGSQLVVVALGDGEQRRGVVFSGDTVNNIDGVNFDVGKPAIYSALIVPEHDERLGEVRRYLRSLRDHAGFELLVSHDEAALEASGIERHLSVARR